MWNSEEMVENWPIILLCGNAVLFSIGIDIVVMTVFNIEENCVVTIEAHCDDIDDNDWPSVKALWPPCPSQSSSIGSSDVANEEMIQ